MMGFGDRWSPLVRNTLLVLVGVYVAQLLIPGMAALLAWSTGVGLFAPWQVLTCLVLGGPDPGQALFDWVGVFFLVPLLDDLMDRRTWVLQLLTCWAVAVVTGLGAVTLGLVDPSVIMGQTALLDAAIAFIGFRMRHAQFLLMFVIPVRAVWLAWITGGMSLLYFLAYRNADTWTMLVCWAAAAVLANVDRGSLRRLSLQWKKGRIERRLRKFEVIDGGKDGPPRTRPEDWVH
jgi:hypothetical protein